MIEESGVVVAVETDCLWVETEQKTTCGKCASRNGCGQRLLAKLTGKSNQIRVLLSPQNQQGHRIGDVVRVGIPESVLVNGALAIYMVPVLALVFGAWFGDAIYATEIASALCSLAGLVLGGLAIRIHSFFRQNDSRFCPVLLG